MENENNTKSTGLPKLVGYLHDLLNRLGRVLKPMRITKDEAEDIAGNYLSLIHIIHLSSGMGGWSSWEHRTYPYAHYRLEVLMDSGLVTMEFINDWCQNNPLPDEAPAIDILSYINWTNNRVSSDPLPIVDPDGEILF